MSNPSSLKRLDKALARLVELTRFTGNHSYLPLFDMLSKHREILIRRQQRFGEFDSNDNGKRNGQGGQIPACNDNFKTKDVDKEEAA